MSPVVPSGDRQLPLPKSGGGESVAGPPTTPEGASELRKCGRCHKNQVLSEFFRKGAHRKQSYCKACGREIQREHFRTNREQHRAWGRDWYQKNKKAQMASAKAWKAAHPDRVRELSRASRRKLRDAVFVGYGGKCSCCGEPEFAFLSLDHVLNNGAEERRLMGGSYFDRLYRRIVMAGFPPQYQVLCFNCNWAKSHGGCPHERRRSGVASV